MFSNDRVKEKGFRIISFITTIVIAFSFAVPFVPANEAIFAEEIRQALLRTLPVIKEKLYDNIGDILVIPYNSFYARIKKLRDRIIYSKEGERELKEMYREAAPYIWHERFAAAVSKQVALESLGNISKQLSDNRSKALFTIKLEKLTQ